MMLLLRTRNASYADATPPVLHSVPLTREFTIETVEESMAIIGENLKVSGVRVGVRVGVSVGGGVGGGVGGRGGGGGGGSVSKMAMGDGRWAVAVAVAMAMAMAGHVRFDVLHGVTVEGGFDVASDMPEHLICPGIRGITS